MAEDRIRGSMPGDSRLATLRLSVSIVVYKSDIDLLARVLDSVRTAGRTAGVAALSIDVINNFDQDELAEELRRKGFGDFLEAEWGRVTVRYSGGNIGYGRANNLSIKASEAEYHLVLNPDAVLEPDALSQGLAYLESYPEVGLLVPKVIGFDGALHYLCKRHPTLFDMFLRGAAPRFIRRVFSRRMAAFELREKDYNGVIRPVEYPTGCCMLFRGPLLRSLGGFDERFFLYLEDADIGRRVLERADVAYVPSMVVHHRWTRGSHGSWRLRWVTIQSAIYYWKKWGGVL
jgi:GT2 family glycosyltransferase